MHTNVNININCHFYADDTQLFIHVSKNAALAFDKLNSCIIDFQAWMLSSRLKLNPDKTEFIISGSHALLKKLDSHLPVRIFGNFMHPAVVIKDLGVWFDANFSFTDCVRNICKTYSFKCLISGGFDSIWQMRLLFWQPMPWWVFALITATLSSGVCPVSTCTKCSVFKTHLLGFSQTVINTHGHLLFSNDSIGYQLNFAVPLKLIL